LKSVGNTDANEGQTRHICTLWSEFSTSLPLWTGEEAPSLLFILRDDSLLKIENEKIIIKN